MPIMNLHNLDIEDASWGMVEAIHPNITMSDDTFIELFEPFSLDNEYAKGGQRKVVRAIRKSNQTEYVIKFVNTDESIKWDSDSEQSSNITNESKSRFISLSHELFLRDHPNITSAEFASESYSAEPFRTGGNLKDYVVSSKGNVPSILNRLKICKGITSGLMVIHIIGLSHFDMKPKNIFMYVNKNGEFVPSIGDFGNLSLNRLDRASKIGTDYWVPNRHSKKDKHDWDIYSVCLVFLTILLWKEDVMTECSKFLDLLKSSKDLDEMCKYLSTIFGRDEKYAEKKDSCFSKMPQTIDFVYKRQLIPLLEMLKFGIMGEECGYKNVSALSIYNVLTSTIKSIIRRKKQIQQIFM